MSIQKEINLGFVELGKDKYPKRSKSYNLLSASDAYLYDLHFPDETSYKRLDLTLLSFFVDDLPDFTKNNEALLRIEINTRDPQKKTEKKDINTIIEFKVPDGQYAPGFIYKGIFRNVFFRDFVNLRISLVEVDCKIIEKYNDVKNLINGVDGFKSIDVLNGIPYLNLASQIFDGMIKIFGRNKDDIIWENMPLLDVIPGPGSAFLRTGIYVIYEVKNSKNEGIGLADLVYRDNKVFFKENAFRLSNCLVMSLRLRNDHGS